MFVTDIVRIILCDDNLLLTCSLIDLTLHITVLTFETFAGVMIGDHRRRRGGAKSQKCKRQSGCVGFVL